MALTPSAVTCCLLLPYPALATYVCMYICMHLYQNIRQIFLLTIGFIAWIYSMGYSTRHPVIERGMVWKMLDLSFIACIAKHIDLSDHCLYLVVLVEVLVRAVR